MKLTRRRDPVMFVAMATSFSFVIPQRASEIRSKNSILLMSDEITRVKLKVSGVRFHISRNWRIRETSFDSYNMTHSVELLPYFRSSIRFCKISRRISLFLSTSETGERKKGIKFESERFFWSCFTDFLVLLIKYRYFKVELDEING